MIVVAFDPGISTGVAIYEDPNICETFTLKIDEVLAGEHLKRIGAHLSESASALVAIEFVPIPTLSKMNQDLLRVVSKLWSDFPRAIIIPPGSWKSSAIALGSRIGAKNQHERDALNIARVVSDRFQKAGVE